MNRDNRNGHLNDETFDLNLIKSEYELVTTWKLAIDFYFRVQIEKYNI